MRLGRWRHTSMTLSVGAPVAKNLNGEQSEPEVRAVASLSRSF